MTRKRMDAPAQTVDGADESPEAAVAKLARIVNHQIDRITVEANLGEILAPDDMDALEKLGRLALGLKKAKPDGIPMDVIKKLDLTDEQLDRLESLLSS